MIKEIYLSKALEILGCIECKGPLSHVEENVLYFGKCDKNYPIEEGLITFLKDDTKVHKTKFDWDKDAQTDFVRSATATPKQHARSPFIKLPPMPPVEYLQDKVYLDLGCGYGRTLIPCTNEGTKISVGIDISPVMLNKCREHCNQYQVNCVLVNSDISDMPFQDKSFDIVYSAAVMLHLDKDVASRTIKEVKRILKANGKAFFYSSFPNKWALWRPIQSPQYITTELIRHQLGCTESEVRDRSYSYSEVARLFEEFSNVEIIPADYRLLPKNIGPFAVPFRSKVIRINEEFSKKMEQSDSKFAQKFLTAFFDIGARV